MVQVPGTMIIRRRAGDEVFRPESASLTATYDAEAEGVALCFYVRAQMGAVTPLPDTADPTAQPNAEVSVYLDDFDPDALVGSRFEVPRSYDEAREDHVSCLYYYEHQDFNHIVVEVLGREGSGFRVWWSVTTRDVDHYDGSEPENRVVI